MKSWRRQSAALVLAAIGAVVQAESPSTAPSTAPSTRPRTQTELREAFDRLAAADIVERGEAFESIIDMGTSVVDPLKSMITAANDLEQRTNAQAALLQIIENAAVGPSMVTLKLDKARPAAAFKELAKQANLPIDLQNLDSSSKRVSLDIQNKPFWEAMRQIQLATGCSLQSHGRPGLSVSQGTHMHGPCSIDGPFMIVARSISMSSSVYLANQNNINRQMTMQFTCFTEPKLQISARPYYVRLTEAVDDQGRSLVFSSASMYDGYSETNQPMWDANATLKVPEPGATKIALLKGSMRLVAAIRSETLEIDDITNAKNVSRMAGPYSLTVKDCTITNNVTTLNVLLTFTSRRGGQNLINQIKLLDAAGTPLQQGETSGSGGMNRVEYKIVYRNIAASDHEGDRKVGKPAKLVLNVPVETRPLEFNFEFKDLPLPR